MLIGVVYVSDGDNPRPSSGKRDESHTNQAALIGMKFADEAIKSRSTRRSNSTWSSSGSAGCPAGKVERHLVMIGVRLPEEGDPVGTIFPSAFFGNLLQRKLLANLLKNPSEKSGSQMSSAAPKMSCFGSRKSWASRDWSRKEEV